jgi:hypothetical protein
VYLLHFTIVGIPHLIYIKGGEYLCIHSVGRALEFIRSLYLVDEHVLSLCTCVDARKAPGFVRGKTSRRLEVLRLTSLCKRT